MKRGEIVSVTLPGAYVKLRPALIIQSDFFNEHPPVTVLPITSKLRQVLLVHLMITPTVDNGLQKPSQIMMDKLHTLRRDKIGAAFGHMDSTALVTINRHLTLFSGDGVTVIALYIAKPAYLTYSLYENVRHRVGYANKTDTTLGKSLDPAGEALLCPIG